MSKRQRKPKPAPADKSPAAPSPQPDGQVAGSEVTDGQVADNQVTDSQVAAAPSRAFQEVPGTPRVVHGPARPPARRLCGVERLRVLLRHSAEVSVDRLCEEAAGLLETCRDHWPGAHPHVWLKPDDPLTRHLEDGN